jgi:hypothetical protein
LIFLFLIAPRPTPTIPQRFKEIKNHHLLCNETGKSKAPHAQQQLCACIEATNLCGNDLIEVEDHAG